MTAQDRVFDPERVSVVSFDSYGTLVDTGSAASVLDGVVDRPEAVAKRWRQNALTYSLVANPIDEYRTYFELHRSGLRDALAAEGVELSEDRLDELNRVYYRLEPFGDVESGFVRLDEAGYAPSILSNGDPEMLDALIESAAIERTVGTVVSADEIRTLKPERELYEHAADRYDVPVESVAHVTAHWMDVLGAIHAGMQGIWLAREGTAWPSFDGEPHETVASIDELCGRLNV